MTARVRIAGKDQTFEAPLGEDLLEVLQQNAYPIATSCGGVATCGLCRVKIASGRELLSPIKPQELTHLGNVAKVIGLRLACQSKIVAQGEIVVEVPEVDDVEERKRKKAERLRSERRHERTGPPSSRALARPGGAAADKARIEWRPRVLESPDDPPTRRHGNGGEQGNS